MRVYYSFSFLYRDRWLADFRYDLWKENQCNDATMAFTHLPVAKRNHKLAERRKSTNVY